MSTSDNKEKVITEEFKQMVIAWVSRDDKIREINKHMKELKNEKKELEQSILKYMNDIDLNILEIGNGKLRRSTSKTKGALKHDSIQNILMKLFNNVEQAHTTAKFILENRPTNETVRLKRTYKKS